MFTKPLLGLFLAILLALSTLSAHANGGFTHVYIAKKSLDAIEDPEIKNFLSNEKYIWAYYLGAHFPDVGYTDRNVRGISSAELFIVAMLTAYLGKKPEDLLTSGKDYGEATHWDDFLKNYKKILIDEHPHPIKDNPVASAFILGVATHRVSDDIWHNRKDNIELNYKLEDSMNYKLEFKNCDKLTSGGLSTSPSCYYGFISKLADLEGLSWDDAHTVADSGVDFAILNDKPAISVDFTKVSSDDFLQALVIASRAVEKMCSQGPCPNIPTVSDMVLDFKAYKVFTVDGIELLAKEGPSVIPKHPSLGDYKRLHYMDWARCSLSSCSRAHNYNYEIDPDVGLNKIEEHVAKFISKLGAELKGQ
jgi:hypothetical protein